LTIDGVGPFLCLLSASLFGAMPIFGKFAYESGVSPDALLLTRFSLAAVVLAVMLLVRPSLRRTHRDPDGAEPTSRLAASPRRVVGIALGLGAVGYAAQASLYFSALRHMDASLLSLILYTYPVLVTVTAVLLGRDRLTSRRGFALATASGGLLLVLLGAGGTGFHPIGAVLAFGSAVVYTAYIVVSDTVVRHLTPAVLATLVMAGAAGTLAAHAVLTGGIALDFGFSGWFWLTCIALVSTVLSTLAFFAGLRRTGPATTAILSTFEPVVTTALASLTLNEFLRPFQLVGGLLVLASVAVLHVPSRAPSTPPLAQRPMELSGSGSGRRTGRAPWKRYEDDQTR
jgi:drug/metabolite transporter (DMT)-like permease